MSKAAQTNPAAHDASADAHRLEITGGEHVFGPRAREIHQGGCLYLTNCIKALGILVVKRACFGYSFALASQC
jgi:hypothetical protein